MVKPARDRREDAWTHVTVRLSRKQLALLTTLTEDQLFRREFIEPKMPGQRLNVEELQLGKDLLDQLRSLQSGGTLAKRPGAARGTLAL